MFSRPPNASFSLIHSSIELRMRTINCCRTAAQAERHPPMRSFGVRPYSSLRRLRRSQSVAAGAPAESGSCLLSFRSFSLPLQFNGRRVWGHGVEGCGGGQRSPAPAHRPHVSSRAKPSPCPPRSVFAAVPHFRLPHGDLQTVQDQFFRPFCAPGRDPVAVILKY